MSLSIEEIKSIAKQITSSKDKTNYNNIIKLINNISIIDIDNIDNIEKTQRFLIVSLFQIFKKLFQRNDLILIKSTSNNDSKIKFIKWCQNLYNSFKNKLLLIISKLTFETSIALDSLDLYMQLIELESEYMSKTSFFPNKTLKNLLISIWNSNIIENEIDPLTGQSKNFILIEFLNKYYSSFTDIQYYTQSELNKIFETEEFNQLNNNNNIGKWLTLMNHDKHYGINPDTKDDDDSFEIFVVNPPQAMENISKFKSLLEKNWLFQLNQSLSFNQYKTILLILHKRIIPFFHTPTKLMDFLTDSYNLIERFPNDKSIGVIPILSLNGLFQLMQSSNLEYPNFYKKLYQLLTPDLMHVKYRPRFFRLMDLFLSSTHLSVHLIASFIKKLARLSLTAPPSAIVTIIPFIYNMLKKHPNCMIMIHNPRFISNPFQTEEQQNQLKENISTYKDPFNMNELDPEITHAFESSLWELSTLMEHYHPNVATLARIFKQPFKKLHYNMEDFLDWGYDSLINAELSRNLKILPTLEFETFDNTINSNCEDNKTTYLENVAW